MARYPAGGRDTRPELRPALLSKNRFEWTGGQGNSPQQGSPDRKIGPIISERKRGTMGDDQEITFEQIKQAIRAGALTGVMEKGDQALMRGLLQFDDEKKAEAYLLEHVNEFSPKAREFLIEAFVADMEETERLYAEGNALFKAADQDVRWLRRVIGDEKLRKSTPSMIRGFLNERLGKNHSIEVIRAVLKSQRVPVLLE